MTYDDSPFRRHEADAYHRDTAPAGGDHTRFRGYPGSGRDTDARAGYQPAPGGGAHHAGPGHPVDEYGQSYPPESSYPSGAAGYQPGHAYHGGEPGYADASYPGSSHTAHAQQAPAGHPAQQAPAGHAVPGAPGPPATRAAPISYLGPGPGPGPGRGGAGAGYGVAQDEEETTRTTPPLPLNRDERELRDEDEPPAPARDRDRMGVHWVWEGTLLLAVGAIGFLLLQSEASALRGSDLSLLLVLTAGYGLLAVGAGLTLRVAAPNLALGPTAVAAAVLFAQQGGDGVLPAAVAALAAALVLGAAIALLVVTFHVPGWAASLAGAAAVVVWLQLQPAEIELSGGYSPLNQAAFLFAMVVAVGVLGGLLGTLAGVRRTVGGFRPTGDPARRAGALPALVTSGAIILSMVFAVAAGVLLVAGFGEAVGPGAPVEGRSGVTWLTWTAIAFGAALLGGTSAFGRRGGVFGTTLAVLGLVLFDRLQAAQGWQIALLATATVALAGGLVVTRLIETFGRPRPEEPSELDPSEPTTSSSVQWETAVPARTGAAPAGRHAEPGPGAEGWSGSPADTWSSALPARPAGGGDPWDDDRWSRR